MAGAIRLSLGERRHADQILTSEDLHQGDVRFHLRGDLILGLAERSRCGQKRTLSDANPDNFSSDYVDASSKQCRVCGVKNKCQKLLLHQTLCIRHDSQPYSSCWACGEGLLCLASLNKRECVENLIIPVMNKVAMYRKS